MTDTATPTADSGSKKGFIDTLKGLSLGVKIILGVFLAGVLFVIFALIGGYAYYSSTQSTMVDKETALSAQYQTNQVVLSTYISTIKEQLGVTQSATASLDKVLLDAVKGRYDQGSTAKPGGGQLFSAITEAYPDLSQNQALYGKLIDQIAIGRAKYEGVQEKLLDMLRNYDHWRKAGPIHSAIVSMIGAPSDTLTARIGANPPLHGQQAEDQMYLIVLTGDAVKAYQTGTMDPLNLGPSASPSPSK